MYPFLTLVPNVYFSKVQRKKKKNSRGTCESARTLNADDVLVLKQATALTLGCNNTVSFKRAKLALCDIVTYTAVKSPPFFRGRQCNTLLLPFQLFDFVLSSLFAALQTSPGADDRAHFNDVYTAACG